MTFQLRDSTRILIRHIRPEDKAMLAKGHSRLSPETVRRRFLAAKPRLTSADLRYLTEVDGRDHVALVALLAEHPHVIVGVGRFVRLAEDRDTAEFAIVVADQLQGQSLGSELAIRLAEEARLRGVRRFTATILSDNEAVRKLLRTISRGLAGDYVATGAVQEIVADLAA